MAASITDYFAKWNMTDHYNRMPTETHEFIDHHAFSNHTMFWTYSPDFTQTRQIKIKDSNNTRATFKTVKLFFFHDGSYLGLFREWVSGVEFKARFLAGKACEHVFRAPTPEERAKFNIPRPRMCLHTSICDKCGLVQVIDSSD
jgi:hypothetical protein